MELNVANVPSKMLFSDLDDVSELQGLVEEEDAAYGKVSRRSKWEDSSWKMSRCCCRGDGVLDSSGPSPRVVIAVGREPMRPVAAAAAECEELVGVLRVLLLLSYG